MDKKFCEFWDRQDKITTQSHSCVELGVYTRSGIVATFGNNMDLSDRYTPLRCAQHAPMLEDETGVERQLMEGDVVGGTCGREDSMCIFYADGLHLVFKDGAMTGNCPTLQYTNPTILGNALATPSLVSKWDTLPAWDLLRERVAEWKAEQVEVKDEYIFLRLATSRLVRRTTNGHWLCVDSDGKVFARTTGGEELHGTSYGDQYKLIKLEATK